MKVSDWFVTATDGVPLITPLELSRDNPASNDPLVMDQVYGLDPPVTARAAE
jgi:hypothetical protein